MARPSMQMTRRDVVKSFGLSALLLHPVLRSMAYAAETPFDRAPRYVMFFKGGAYYPSRTNPSALTNLAGTPIAPLQPHASDLILFKNMNIHGGSPKSDGYKEEHAAGVYGCTTGNTYKYYKNDAYFAYTDNESIDVRIANHYKNRPDLKDVPLKSLHIGAGAHSDADQVGIGNRFISFRNREAGDTRYGNAIEPMQDAGQVYDMLMQAAVASCAPHSNQAQGDTAKMTTALARRASVVDFILADIKDAKRQFGMDSEHARKLDGLLENWSQSEKSARQLAQAAPAGASVKGADKRPQCLASARPDGKGANKQNLDLLSPVHDQMIAMIKFAFETDLTRVVAFTLSGGSSGQTWPSRGIHTAHHTLEHNGDVESLVKLDTYYSEKFAALLTALKSVDDGGGKTALYNSSVFLGMECWSNSSSGHYLTNVPFIFAGQGGGRFKTGQIVNASGRNNNDLHVACQNAAGIASNTFGLASLCKGPII
jgi:Protein of unknown function (DUF1552)